MIEAALPQLTSQTFLTHTSVRGSIFKVKEEMHITRDKSSVALNKFIEN